MAHTRPVRTLSSLFPVGESWAVVGPGARKPTVGEGIESRRPLFSSSVIAFFSFSPSHLHLFLVCVNNNHMRYDFAGQDPGHCNEPSRCLSKPVVFHLTVVDILHGFKRM